MRFAHGTRPGHFAARDRTRGDVRPRLRYVQAVHAAYGRFAAARDGAAAEQSLWGRDVRA